MDRILAPYMNKEYVPNNNYLVYQERDKVREEMAAVGFKDIKI